MERVKIKSVFQNQLLNDPQTLKDLLKLYHPKMPEQWMKGKEVRTIDGLVKNQYEDYDCEVRVHYDWITFHVHIEDYGYIGLAVTNNYHLLYGDKISPRDYRRAVRDGKVNFQAWRFVTDKYQDERNFYEILFDESIPDDEKELYGNEHIIMNDFFKERGYQLKTPKEFIQYYYSD